MASTPGELGEVPALIGVLAAALGDAVAPESVASEASAASASAGTSVRAPGSAGSVLVSMRDRVVGSPWWIAPERFIRRFIRPTLAEVTVLRDVRERPRGSVEHVRPSDDDRPSNDGPASP